MGTMCEFSHTLAEEKCPVGNRREMSGRKQVQSQIWNRDPKLLPLRGKGAMEAGCGRASEQERERSVFLGNGMDGRPEEGPSRFPSPPLEACNASRVRSHQLSVRLLYTEKKREGRKGKPGLACPWGGADWKTTARARQKKQLAAGGSRAESREAI